MGAQSAYLVEEEKRLEKLRKNAIGRSTGGGESALGRSKHRSGSKGNLVGGHRRDATEIKGKGTQGKGIQRDENRGTCKKKLFPSSSVEGSARGYAICLKGELRDAACRNHELLGALEREALVKKRADLDRLKPAAALTLAMTVARKRGVQEW